VQAHLWTNLAAAGGNATAARARDGFSRVMSADQIGEAQRLARDWAASHQPAPRR